MHNRRAFTLIELLVVVAIIVALIAILLPAMGRAIYTANLAICGSHIKQIGLGATNYAADFHRSYPYRYTNGKPNDIMQGGIDDRPVIDDYVDLHQLINCPMLEPVDWVNTNPTSSMESAYNLFFGYGYAGETRMSKIGTRWTWAGRSYDLLVSDRDVVANNNDYVHGTHPDRDGIMYNEALNQAASPLGGNYTLSRWINYDRSDRGLIDMNAGYADLSVHLLSGLEVNDERLTPVPEFANGSRVAWAPSYVPAQK